MTTPLPFIVAHQNHKAKRKAYLSRAASGVAFDLAMAARSLLLTLTLSSIPFTFTDIVLIDQTQRNLTMVDLRTLTKSSGQRAFKEDGLDERITKRQMRIIPIDKAFRLKDSNDLCGSYDAYDSVSTNTSDHLVNENISPSTIRDGTVDFGTTEWYSFIRYIALPLELAR
ncbi:unnamed protein product [Cyclocybe aegerita]|uniref:Uncharacterized protein n=1 Tax=Cyclocybe aegerita TaxID=1973307 RepID=A0A8S0VQ50_CYCAE|nr:unnamed protein product [Cyclocybe aegerita]